MRNMLEIARMEFKLTAANKAFVIITIIGPFIIMAFAFLPSLFAERATETDEGTTIAVVGARRHALEQPRRRHRRGTYHPGPRAVDRRPRRTGHRRRARGLRGATRRLPDR